MGEKKGRLMNEPLNLSNAIFVRRFRLPTGVTTFTNWYVENSHGENTTLESDFAQHRRLINLDSRESTHPDRNHLSRPLSSFLSCVCLKLKAQ